MKKLIVYEIRAWNESEMVKAAVTSFSEAKAIEDKWVKAGFCNPYIEKIVAPNMKIFHEIIEYNNRNYIDDMYFEQKAINDDMNWDEGDGWNNTIY